MDPVINSYNSDGVDRELLTATGPGGLLTDGTLRDEPIESYLGTEEHPVFLLSNGTKGVSYERLERGQTGRYRPGADYGAFALITESRLIFLIGDNRSGPEYDRTVSVPLVDVEIVEQRSGMLTNELVVRTATDVRWRFPCRRDLEQVVSYVESASSTWMTVAARISTARTRLVEASQRLDARDYEAAMGALDAAADDTAVAREREQTFCTGGVPSIAARIDPVEERTAEMRLQVLQSRATRSIDRAERHWRDGNYESAHEAYTAARADYEAALAICESAATARDLRERADRVERNLAELERAPLERADRARERAREADEPGDRAALLQLALDRYRSALSLDWGRDDKRFEGDTIELRFCIDSVASELVETRSRVAAHRALEATDAYAAGRFDEAAEHYRRARQEFDRARGTASELVPEAVESLTRAREALAEVLADPALPVDPEGVESAASDERTTGAKRPDETNYDSRRDARSGRGPTSDPPSPGECDGQSGHVTLRSP